MTEPTPPARRIGMAAGEASGDLLASLLLKGLHAQLPQDIAYNGIGGARMMEQGFTSNWPMHKLSVNGYVEVLGQLREILAIRKGLKQDLLANPPMAFIGVDAPDFNFNVEIAMRQAGVPVVHFVSPSIWAWRAGRIKTIARAVDHILCLFPFEPEIYARAGIPATYVGHPLANVIPLEPDRTAARRKLGLREDDTVVALLPGSRQSELHFMAETFIETAKHLLDRYPKLQFLVPLVSRETRLQFETALWKLKADELPFTLMFGHAADAIAASDAVLVASGTATLETALVGRPMVIAYKMSPWSWRLMRGMRYLPWVGLPNILAGRYVVPEFLQDDATPENLSQALGNLLVDRQARAAITRVFDSIHRLLRQDTSLKAADAVLPYLQKA